jgi:hypothetical protein
VAVPERLGLGVMQGFLGFLGETVGIHGRLRRLEDTRAGAVRPPSAPFSSDQHPSAGVDW